MPVHPSLSSALWHGFYSTFIEPAILNFTLKQSLVRQTFCGANFFYGVETTVFVWCLLREESLKYKKALGERATAQFPQTLLYFHSPVHTRTFKEKKVEKEHAWARQ